MFTVIFFGLLSCLAAELLPGRRLYNSSREMCCDGAVHTISGRNTSCCGRVPYDPSVNACCGDSLVELPDDLRRLGRYSCCFDNRGRFTSLYDDNDRLCCDGVLSDWPAGAHQAGCCNGKPFDPTKSHCDGIATFRSHRVSWSPSPEHLRRRSRPISGRGGRVAGFLCSGGGDVFGQGKPIGKECCLLAGQLYEPTGQACCFDTVIDVTESDRQAGWDTCCLRFPFENVVPE